MRTPSLTKARIGMLALGLAAAVAARAGDRLGTEAPAGVDLIGRWELDAARSDDPAQVRAAWQRALPKPKPPARLPDATRRGAPPGDAAPPAPPDGTAAPVPRDGARPQREADGGALRAGTGPAALPLATFLDAIANPPTLELRASSADLELPRADGTVACTPGDVVAVMDRHGDSQRRCGWRKGALVVVQEVKRGPRREDRYELTPDGALAWTTTLTAKKSPPLVAHRIYRRGGPATGAALPAAPRGVPAN